MILALDLATRTGWAVGSESGVIDLHPGRGDSPGIRFLKLRSFLETTRKAYPSLELVVYERAHHRGGAATEVCVGLATHVQSWCAEHGIEHMAVPTRTLKMYATGKGNASKEDMLAAASARWPGRLFVDDNHVDAAWLLSYATLQVKGEER